MFVTAQTCSNIAFNLQMQQGKPANSVGFVVWKARGTPHVTPVNKPALQCIIARFIKACPGDLQSNKISH